MGFMIKMTLGEALSKYADTLSLAALGAIEKKGESDKVRVIFDAMRAVLTSHAIKARERRTTRSLWT